MPWFKPFIFEFNNKGIKLFIKRQFLFFLIVGLVSSIYKYIIIRSYLILAGKAFNLSKIVSIYVFNFLIFMVKISVDRISSI